MDKSPQGPSPTFLSQQAVNAKFAELDGDTQKLRAWLNNTCKAKKIKVITSVTAQLSGRQPRRADWQGEQFFRKGDNFCQATIYWRKTPDGEEEIRVQQFTAPDGTWYMVDHVDILLRVQKTDREASEISPPTS